MSRTRPTPAGTSSGLETLEPRLLLSAAVQMTLSPGTDLQPAWSPNGQTILFASDRVQAGQFDLYSVSAATGETVLSPASPVVTGAASEEAVAYSPNGTRIAFQRTDDTGASGIWVAGSDGSSPLQVAASGIDPSWSPDGSQIVFSDQGQLWVVGANSTGLSLLYAGAGQDLCPSWSPDGTKIAFASNAGGQWALWTVASNGTGARQLVASSSSAKPAWRPDGAEIAFEGSDQNLWAISPADSGNLSTLRQITSLPSWNSDPSWSPDGTKIAFTSNRSGNDEIWVVAAGGEGELNGIALTRKIAYGVPGSSLDDSRLMDVKIGGVGITDVQILTPWGESFDSASLVPGNWNGQSWINASRGALEIQGYSDTQQTVLDFSWGQLTDAQWSSLDSGSVTITVTYRGGQWSGSSGFQGLTQPLAEPLLSNPVNRQVEPGNLTAQWASWAGAPAGGDIHVVLDETSVSGLYDYTLPTSATSTTLPQTLADSAYRMELSFENSLQSTVSGIMVTATAGTSNSVFFVVGAAGDDAGNSSATAKPIVLGSPAAGSLDYLGDIDYFSFHAAAGQTYEVQVTLPSGGVSDSTASLYGTDGRTLLSWDDDGGTGNGSRLLWTAPADGTYYLAVDAYDVYEQLGAYTLQISVASQSWNPPTAWYGGSGTGKLWLDAQGNRGMEISQLHFGASPEDGWSVLHLLDLSNPKVPVQIGSYAISRLGATAGFKPGTDLYYLADDGTAGSWVDSAGTSHAQLVVLDAGGGGDPVEVARLPIALEDVVSLAIQGNYLYAATQPADASRACLEVYDISAAIPVLVGQSSLLVNSSGSMNPSGLLVQGGRAYMLDSQTGVLSIFNVANPTVPSLLGQYTVTASPAGLEDIGSSTMALSGTVLWVGVDRNLLGIDVSNPAHPAQVASLAMGARVGQLLLSDTNLFVATVQEGAVLVDVSSPLSPSIAARYNLAGTVGTLALDSDQLYLPTFGSQTGIFDLTATPPSSWITTASSSQGHADIALSYAAHAGLGGSPVTSVDIYVSVDGGAYSLFESAAPSSGVVYTGSPGHTYRFYTVATDASAAQEAAPLTPDATVTLWPTEQIVLGGATTRAARTDADGTPLTISYSGPGTATILRWSNPSNQRGDIFSIAITGSTTASTLSITTTGVGSAGLTCSGGIVVNGSLGSLTAGTTSLLGDLTVTGSLGTLTLDDLLGPHTITIGPAASAWSSVSMTFDQVRDLSIVSQSYIASIRASEWLRDSGAASLIQAPRIGTLTIAGRLASTYTGVTALAGDFQGDLVLTDGTAYQTLGSATIAGSLGSGDWDIAGKVGTLTVHGSLGAAGAGNAWRLHDATGLSSLSAGDATNAILNVVGDIATITVKSWTTGSITAQSLASLTDGGLFGANVTLALPGGAPSYKQALGYVTIGGAMTNSTWAVTGKAGSLTASGNVNGFALGGGGAGALTGLSTLSLGTVTSATVNVSGAVGTVSAKQWNSGLIHAATLSSLTVSAGWNSPGGNFAANLTLDGTSSLYASTLGSANIAGALSGGTWDIAGKVGSVTVGGAVGTAGDSTAAWKLLDATGLSSFTAGDVTNAILNVAGDIATITVKSWAGGSITAQSLGSLTTTGAFAINVSLALPPGAPTYKQALGSVRIGGALTNSVWSITGKAGTFTVTGDASGLALGDNAGDLAALSTLSLGNVTSSSVNVAGDISSITAKSWTSGSIAAQSLASLTTTGNFGANVTLTLPGNAPTYKQALGSARIGGALTNSAWAISGKAGTFTVTGDASGLFLGGGSGALTGLSSLSLGNVSNSYVSVAGDISSVTTKNWTSGSLAAQSISSLSASGNFGAGVELALPPGAPSYKQALGSARISGALTNSTWAIAGKVGSFSAGDASGFTLGGDGPAGDLTGLSSLTLGNVAGAAVTVSGAIGTVSAKQWSSGSIHAATLSTLTVAPAWNTPGGNFGADLTLDGTSSLYANTLNSVSIAGTLTGGNWNVSGKVGGLSIKYIQAPMTMPNAKLSSITTSTPLLRVLQSGVPVALQAVNAGGPNYPITFASLASWPKTVGDVAS